MSGAQEEIGHVVVPSTPMVEAVTTTLSTIQHGFQQLPGSAIVLRYVKSSYQNDPIRSLLELILLIFAIRTILQSRTRGGSSSSNFVKLTEKVSGYFFKHMCTNKAAGNR